jgi:hypothetical protein
MIQSGSAEKITKAFMIGVVDFAFVILVISAGKGASKIGNHFDHAQGELKTSWLVSIFLQTSGILLGIHI